MDAESLFIAELERRIKDALEAIQRQDNTIIEKDAEIERLKADHAIVRSFLDKADAKLLSHEKLITELCDALYDHLGPATSKALTPDEKLIQRAREATR